MSPAMAEMVTPHTPMTRRQARIWVQALEIQLDCFTVLGVCVLVMLRNDLRTELQQKREFTITRLYTFNHSTVNEANMIIMGTR